MKHLSTSRICDHLPPEIWNIILAKTDPQTCILFEHEVVIGEIKGIDQEHWLRRAASTGHLGVVQALYWKVYNGYYAIYLAAAKGHIEIVKWLCKSEASSPDFAELVEMALICAAGNGHLRIVEWLHKNWKYDDSLGIMDYAAEGGHLEVVQWFHVNQREGCSTWAMDFAAKNGHLEVVQWLHENRTEGCTTYAMDHAARKRLEVLKWLLDNRQEGCSEEAMDYAAMNGHLEVVEWIYQHRTKGCRIWTDDVALWSALDLCCRERTQ